MSQQTTEAKNYDYLSKAPGFQIIKAGTYQKKELNGLLGIPALKSQIIDVPVTSKENAITMGYFDMQPGEEFEFVYEFLEVKFVIKGQFILRDEQGKKYVAKAGDVVIFTPNVPVIFDAESDGEAFYTAHRIPEPSFL
ncbi:cupin domain-containing protein [Peribacillus sp. JNUCC 23]|uniref:cupin domain-containing protein n=1 Tax=Peribacillus sp. NPDC096379 TaxID=3364393 RepID=UPI00078466CB